MSFNPHLGDLGSSSSWETISSDSSEKGSSSVFFGGATHTFSIFRSSSSSSDITAGGRKSSLSSFGQGPQKSSSLPDVAKEVDNSFEEKGSGSDEFPNYDPSDLVGKSVSLDSGIDKKGSQSKTDKIRKTVRGFFKSSPKPPSMKSFIGHSSDFPDPYEDQTSANTKKTTSIDKNSQKQTTFSTSVSKKTVGAKPKVSQKKPTNPPKKTDSFSKLKSIFKGSVKSQTKPKTPPKPPRSGITKSDISQPMSTKSGTIPKKRPAPQRPSPKRPAPQPPTDLKKSLAPKRPSVSPPPVPSLSSVPASSSLGSSVNPLKLQDQLKDIWSTVETTSPQTYKWLGQTLITTLMQKVEGLVLKPEDKNVSITKTFTEFRSQCNGLISGNTEDARAILCALFDKTTDSDTPFSEILEDNEGSDLLVDLFRKIEGTFNPPRMRLFLSVLASDMGTMTSVNAKYLTTSGNGVDTRLGASAVTSSLDRFNGLLQGNHNDSWSDAAQVLVNDTFS